MVRTILRSAAFRFKYPDPRTMLFTSVCHRKRNAPCGEILSGKCSALTMNCGKQRQFRARVRLGTDGPPTCTPRGWRTKGGSVEGEEKRGRPVGHKKCSRWRTTNQIFAPVARGHGRPIVAFYMQSRVKLWRMGEGGGWRGKGKKAAAAAADSADYCTTC